MFKNRITDETRMAVRQFVERNPRDQTAPRDRGIRFNIVKGILSGLVLYDPTTNMVKLKHEIVHDEIFDGEHRIQWPKSLQ